MPSNILKEVAEEGRDRKSSERRKSEVRRHPWARQGQQETKRHRGWSPTQGTAVPADARCLRRTPLAPPGPLPHQCPHPAGPSTLSASGTGARKVSLAAETPGEAHTHAHTHTHAFPASEALGDSSLSLGSGSLIEALLSRRGGQTRLIRIA